MKQRKVIFKTGVRPSNLALVQSRDALDRVEAMLPGLSFEQVTIASVGDGDRTTDLRESPDDFFTRELDDALLAGEVDLAVHSAKDLPPAIREGIDWFWLPWQEEPRDVLVLAPGRDASDLPKEAVIGVSSERRAEYCANRFPGAVQKNIRGNIEERIAQVDSGAFDAVIMAAAALVRLGLQERITEWIPLDELEVPDAQGYLAVTFRTGDERLMRLRSLFVRAVTFAGAGVGRRGLCTVDALDALKECDICLHDSLMDKSLLDTLPAHAVAIDVGKRCGAHSRQQHETTRLLCECARQSKRIVRLKGGDPGIFGRLAEETAALEQLGIPYHVIPGISALQAATTGTGMLFTRRDVSRGFAAITPRVSGGALAPCDAETRSRLPVIYYMSIKAMEPITNELLQDGWAPETPAAIVFNAGGDNETVIKTTLSEIPVSSPPHCVKQPGLIMVGDITSYAYDTSLGALKGQSVLLTCSEAIQHKAAATVRDFGGIPIHFPLIRLLPRTHAPLSCSGFDRVVITSPSSVRAFMQLIEAQQIDLRSIPSIMVCGQGTADELCQHGIHADISPSSGFSAEGLIETAKEHVRPDEKILRVRSDKAGPHLAEALRAMGADVEDLIIYDNEPRTYDGLPAFDAVFFASSSAVQTFIRQWGASALDGRITCVIGQPTARALKESGVTPHVIAGEATVSGAINSLAQYYIGEELCSLKYD